MRHARATIVSSTVGTSVVSEDNGATNFTAFNYVHAQSLPANTVVDVLHVGNKAYVIGAYGAGPVGTVLQQASWSAQAGAGGSGTSTTYITFATSGYPTLVFNKQIASSKVLFLGATSGYVTVASGSVNIGIYDNVSNTYTTVGHLYFNPLSTHLSIPCGGQITGLAAGAHTFQLAWNVSSGSTFNLNTDDTMRFIVSEVC
jgi:hypothetical protein